MQFFLLKLLIIRCCWCEAYSMCIKWPHMADWVFSVSQPSRTSQRGNTASYFSFLLSYVFSSSVSLLFFFHCLSQSRIRRIKTKALVAVWSLSWVVIMTSPLKVKLSHWHDEICGEKEGSQTRERSVEITNPSSQMVLRKNVDLIWGCHLNIFNKIINLVPLSVSEWH